MGAKKNAGSRAATEANRLTGMGIEGLQPFLQAGTGQLDALTQGASIGGLDERLSEIFNSETFSSLFEDRQRAQQGQLSAGGLTRSGTALTESAGLSSELGLMIEQLLSGRSGQLAGQGLAAGGGIADLFARQGETAASGILTDAESRASFGSQIFQVASGILFSDERLKTNIMQIGKIGILPLYEWDWIPNAKDTVVWDFPRVGFMSGDIKKVFPHLVGEISGGWKVVDYQGVLAELQANLNRDIREVKAA